MAIETVGIIATCLGVVKGIPQFVKINKDDNVSSFSIHAIIIGIVASLLWLYYACSIKSKSLMGSACIGLFAEVYIILKLLKMRQLKDIIII